MSATTRPIRSRRSLTWAIARIAVCLGALGLVLAGVDLDDRVRLLDGEVLTGEVVEDRAGLRVLRPGLPPRSVAADRVALQPDGTRDVQLGLRTVWRTARADWMLAAVVAFIPITFMLGWRFQLVLRTQDIALGYLDAVKLTFAGSFLSFVPFLLGAYGGDVFKAYFVSLHTDRKTEAVTSVVLDRALGLGGVLVIVTGAAAISPAGSIVRGFLWPMLAVSAAGAAAAGVYLWPPLRRLLPRRWISSSRWIGQLRRVDDTVRRLARHPGTVVLCVVIAVLRQLAAFASYLLVALSLGMAIGVADLVEVCAYFAAGVAVGAVPISPQGLGTVELAYSVFFRDYGTPSQILCLAFGVRLVHLLGTLPGLIVVGTGAYRPPPLEDVEARLGG
ncbi:MAG: flippase-like domain-containing protein [Deltaproteobacteria bacterium]|nr:flippase-like domain-containing protein [Deltaproteobacteria bacterium]MBW2413872.1 flippase-like domain-containing protein [Deltaproteobacteria bacterium]